MTRNDNQDRTPVPRARWHDGKAYWDWGSDPIRKINVHGYDAYGMPVTEVITATANPQQSWLSRMRACLMRHWPERYWNIAYRLGLTSIRRVSGIHVTDHDANTRPRVSSER